MKCLKLKLLWHRWRKKEKHSAKKTGENEAAAMAGRCYGGF